MGLFGPSYDDNKLKVSALHAIKENPMLRDFANVSFIVEKGVITIIGEINSQHNKEKVLKVVKDKLDKNGLKYKKIENNLEIK